MNSISDYLHDSQDLPLHQAILNNDSAKAIQLIHQYIIKPFENQGIILGRCELSKDGILAQNIYGEPCSLPIKGIAESVKIVNNQHITTAMRPEKLGPAVVQLSSAHITPDGILYPGKIQIYGNPPIVLQSGLDANILWYIDKTTDNIFLTNKLYQTALHLAVQQTLYDVAVLLIEKGLKINAQDARGYTPLHYACISGDEKMIDLLITHDANIEIGDAESKARPSELLKKKTYSKSTLKLLYYPDPYSASGKNTELHQLLTKLKNNGKIFDQKLFDRIKTLALVPYCLLKNSYGTLPSQLTKNEKLKSYLHYCEQLQSYLSDYHSLVINIKLEALSKKVINQDCLILLNKLITSMIDFFNDEKIIKNEKTLLNRSLDLLAKLAHCVSYDLKRYSYDRIPWQNLEYLMVINADSSKNAIALKNKFLENFILTELSVIDNRLIQLQKDYEKQALTKDLKDLAVSHDPKLPALHFLTDPIMELCSLQKIAAVLAYAVTFNTDTQQGRLALIRAIKLIGEFSKYSQMSRRLSYAVKNYFDDVPWQILTELRDKLAKNSKSPTSKQNFLQLVIHGDNLLFNNLKQDLSNLATEVNKVLPQYAAMLLTCSREQLEQLYAHQELKVKINLPANDIQYLIQTATQKKQNIVQTINKKQKQLSYLEKDPAKIKNLEQTKKDIAEEETALNKLEELLAALAKGRLTYNQKDQILRTIIPAAHRQIWSQKFEQAKAQSSLPRLAELLNTIKKPVTKQAKISDYDSAIDLLKQLAFILYGDSQLIERINQSPELIDAPSAEQQAIYQALTEYRSSAEKRFAAEQLFADLYLILKTLNINENKLLRDFFEHNNDAYDTLDKPINHAVFFALYHYLRNISQQLNSPLPQASNLLFFNQNSSSTSKPSVAAITSSNSQFKI